jgi:hypothetical protein
MARLLACALWLAAAGPALAQPLAAGPGPAPALPPPPPPPPDTGPTVRDASVGYIDSAPPADQLRLRADLGSDFPTPNRAEFFYPRSRPGGPGLPRPERSINFQEYTLYLEKTLEPAWSVFVEGGARAIDPEINANSTGPTDANVGFKYAFVADPCQVWTFQLRAYLPSGSTSRGLGTGHVTVEPAVLGFVRLTQDLGLAAELRYWDPIGGTDFAGPVVRYGLGLRYDLWQRDDWRFAPTVEAVGWSVLSGRESRLSAAGIVRVLDSGGTNVVNLKLGARIDLGEQAGLFVGYGRAVTGERWYRDIVRVEFRWLY